MWQKVGTYTNGDFPFMIKQCWTDPVWIISPERYEPFSGEIVGLFIRNTNVQKAIRARDPRILDFLAEILDCIDQISMEMEEPGNEQDHTCQSSITGRVPQHGFVYFLLADNGLYKIGRAKNIDNRIKQFDIKLPYDFQLIHAVESDDYVSTEEIFHDHFADKRVKGEWFELSKADVEYIKGLGMTA